MMCLLLFLRERKRETMTKNSNGNRYMWASVTMFFFFYFFLYWFCSRTGNVECFITYYFIPEWEIQIYTLDALGMLIFHILYIIHNFNVCLFFVLHRSCLIFLFRLSYCFCVFWFNSKYYHSSFYFRVSTDAVAGIHCVVLFLFSVNTHIFLCSVYLSHFTISLYFFSILIPFRCNSWQYFIDFSIVLIVYFILFYF